MELWEAAVLFCLYIGYVVIMQYNESIKAWAMSRRKPNAAGIQLGGPAEIVTVKEPTSARSSASSGDIEHGKPELEVRPLCTTHVPAAVNSM